jgi:hypothetical protein
MCINPVFSKFAFKFNVCRCIQAGWGWDVYRRDGESGRNVPLNCACGISVTSSDGGGGSGAGSGGGGGAGESVECYGALSHSHGGAVQPEFS